LGIALILGALSLPAALLSLLALITYWSSDHLIVQYPIVGMLASVVMSVARLGRVFPWPRSRGGVDAGSAGGAADRRVSSTLAVDRLAGSPRIEARVGEDGCAYRSEFPMAAFDRNRRRATHGDGRIKDIESALDGATHRFSVATSQVDGMSAEGVEAFLQTFPQGGVGVDVAGQL
jgi:hypothetical protein